MEISVWFKNLSAPERINIMCDLLNFCCPIETYFISTFLENICNSTENNSEVQNAESNSIETTCDNINSRKLISAKSKESLEEIQCVMHESGNPMQLICKPVFRKKLILATALLSIQDNKNASVIFKIVSDGFTTNSLSKNFCLNDEVASNEILLLLTLILYHPAFTFHQKSTFFEDITMLRKHCQIASTELYHVLKINDSDSGNSINVISLQERQTPKNNQGQIQQIGIKKRKKKKFLLEITWSTAKKTVVVKSFSDVITFHEKLVQSFPNTKLCESPNSKFHNLTAFSSNANDRQTVVIPEYFRDFLERVPLFVKDSKFVLDFFKPPTNQRPVLVGSSFDLSTWSSIISSDSTLSSGAGADVSSATTPSSSSDGSSKVQGFCFEKNTKSKSKISTISVSSTSMKQDRQQQEDKNKKLPPETAVKHDVKSCSLKPLCSNENRKSKSLDSLDEKPPKACSREVLSDGMLPIHPKNSADCMAPKSGTKEVYKEPNKFWHSRTWTTKNMATHNEPMHAGPLNVSGNRQGASGNRTFSTMGIPKAFNPSDTFKRSEKPHFHPFVRGSNLHLDPDSYKRHGPPRKL